MEYIWVEPVTAVELLRNGNAALEGLRLGHGLLEAEQFAEALLAKELRVLVFSNKTAALITVGKCADGLAFNILTVYGDLARCGESIPPLEDAARELGCKLIYSVGHPGWARVMRNQGYDIHKRLLMRKNL